MCDLIDVPGSRELVVPGLVNPFVPCERAKLTPTVSQSVTPTRSLSGPMEPILAVVTLSSPYSLAVHKRDSVHFVQKFKRLWIGQIELKSEFPITNMIEFNAMMYSNRLSPSTNNQNRIWKTFYEIWNGNPFGFNLSITCFHFGERSRVNRASSVQVMQATVAGTQFMATFHWSLSLLCAMLLFPPLWRVPNYLMVQRVVHWEWWWCYSMVLGSLKSM